MGRRDSFGGIASTLIGAGAVAGAAEFLKDTIRNNADLKRAESNGDVLVSGLKNAASNGMNAPQVTYLSFLTISWIHLLFLHFS